MRKVRNKWQFIFKFEKAFEYMDGIRRLQFGIVNFKSFPAEGQMFDKRNYKGFFREYEFLARRTK